MGRTHQPAPAQLIEQSISVEGTTAAVGAALEVSDTVLKAGDKQAKRVSVSFYLGLHKRHDADDVRIGKRKVGNLQGGDTSRGSSSFQIPDEISPGPYYVLGCVGGGEDTSCRATRNTITVTAAAPTATLTSIAVNPANPSVARGGSQQLTATATLSDGTTQDVTNGVTWNTSDANVATVSNAAGSQGLATGINAGSTTITAARDGVNGTALLTVTPATLTSIAV